MASLVGSRRSSVVWEPTSTEPEIASYEIELGQEIAKGAYGTVYKGKCRGLGVAVKLLHNQHLSGPKLRELKREVEIMSRLRHPGILLLMGVCTEPSNIALVMEYVEGKSLEQIIRDPQVPLTTFQKFELAKDIAKSIHWLHCLDPPIIHRDLKPANVLVDADFQVKICDFGLSMVKPTHPSGQLNKKVLGSPMWMSPEVMAGEDATEKSDVYAYSIVLWELFTRLDPSEAFNITDVRKFMDQVVNEDKRLPFPKDFPKPVASLIERCWHRNPRKRPDFETILEELDDIIIELMIADKVGRDLWRDLKNEPILGEHHPFLVEWEHFLNQLCAKIKVKRPADEDLSVLCLRMMIATTHKDLTRSSCEKAIRQVYLDHFGKFLDCFGPLNEGQDILAKFKDVCQNQWFHGSIGVKEAEKALKGQQRGTFLLRTSSAPNSCFTISRINESNRIVHQRIMRTFREGGEFVMKIGDDLKSSASLQDLVEITKDDLMLHHACPGSPFAPLFCERSAEDETISLGYISGDVINHRLAELVSKKELQRGARRGSRDRGVVGGGPQGRRPSLDVRMAKHNNNSNNHHHHNNNNNADSGILGSALPSHMKDKESGSTEEEEGDSAESSFEDCDGDSAESACNTEEAGDHSEEDSTDDSSCSSGEAAPVGGGM